MRAATTNNLLIIGAGQYGVVTKEVAESMGVFDVISFLDDNNPEAIGKISDYCCFKKEFCHAIVAIGNSDLRFNLLEKLKMNGFNIPVLVHNRAYISPTAKIGIGSIIEPMVVIHSNVNVGLGCLISAGAIINHNSEIGDFSHINCGVIVAARAVVEKYTRTECGIVLA